MRTYKVISPFRKRTPEGKIMTDMAGIGEVVELNDSDGKKLMAVQCVVPFVPVEARVVDPPENRKRGRPRKHDINSGH